MQEKNSWLKNKSDKIRFMFFYIQGEVLSKYASALVNIKGLGVKTFSYLIPDDMKDKIQIGQALLVPFGRQGLINAFCVGFSDYLPGDFKVKKINKILDETPLFSID